MLDLKVPTETREVGFSMYAAVDIWSTGILIASMFLRGKNLFMPECNTKTTRSKCKKEELRELIRVCGTETLPKVYFDVFPDLTRSKDDPLRSLISKFVPHKCYEDLICDMLVFEPKDRPTMEELLHRVVTISQGFGSS